MYARASQGVHLISEEHMYEFLDLRAKMNRTDIIFSIRLPIFKKEIFSLRRIIALPMNNTECVITPNYLAIHEDEMSYYKEKYQFIRNIYSDICNAQPHNIYLQHIPATLYILLLSNNRT